MNTRSLLLSTCLLLSSTAHASIVPSMVAMGMFDSPDHSEQIAEIEYSATEVVDFEKLRDYGVSEEYIIDKQLAFARENGKYTHDLVRKREELRSQEKLKLILIMAFAVIAIVPLVILMLTM